MKMMTTDKCTFLSHILQQDHVILYYVKISYKKSTINEITMKFS